MGSGEGLQEAWYRSPSTGLIRGDASRFFTDSRISVPRYRYQDWGPFTLGVKRDGSKPGVPTPRNWAVPKDAYPAFLARGAHGIILDRAKGACGS